MRSSKNDNSLSISEATFNLVKTAKVDVPCQYSHGSVKKIDVPIQNCFCDVQKVDNVSQYSGNRGQFIDLTHYIDYRDLQVNNIKMHSVHPEYKAENLFNNHYGQNNKTTSIHYKNHVINDHNACPYILWNTQLRRRHDFNVGCRSRYSQHREHKVNSTNQYCEHCKDKLKNSNQFCDRHDQMIRNSHYQKEHSRHKTHASLYHCSVCREHAKNKYSYNKVAESGEKVIRINND